MSEQLELGEVWEDAAGLILCSCGGRVALWDRRLETGLVVRTSRCLSCESRVEVLMSAPAPKRRAAPLLSTMGRGER